MNTPYSVVQPNNFVSNTEFQTKVDTVENCGAHMTIDPNTAGWNSLYFFYTASNPQSRSAFISNAHTQVVSYGKDAPTQYTRSSNNGGGEGFKINKTGYYELYGQYRAYPDFTNWQHRIEIRVDDENDNPVDTWTPSQYRTVREQYPANVKDGVPGEKITRINPLFQCGISLKKGDSVYLCVNPVYNDGIIYQYSVYFSVKYIGNNAEFLP